MNCLLDMKIYFMYFIYGKKSSRKQFRKPTPYFSFLVSPEIAPQPSVNFNSSNQIPKYCDLLDSVKQFPTVCYISFEKALCLHMLSKRKAIILVYSNQLRQQSSLSIGLSNCLSWAPYSGFVSISITIYIVEGFMYGMKISTSASIEFNSICSVLFNVSEEWLRFLPS